jgi:hypothetical protein
LVLAKCTFPGVDFVTTLAKSGSYICPFGIVLAGPGTLKPALKWSLIAMVAGMFYEMVLEL